MTLPVRANAQNIDATWFNDIQTEITSEISTVQSEIDGKNGSHLINAGFGITLAGNALTIGLKQNDGSLDPSTSNPVGAFFDYLPGGLTRGSIARTLTSSLSITIPSGASIGTRSGLESRVYVFLYWTGSDIALGVSTSYLNEELNYTATAITGTPSDEAAFYGSTAVGGVSIRYLGYFDSTQATAGTWVTNPSRAVVGRPPIPRNVICMSETFTAASVSPASGIASIANNAYTAQFNLFSGDTNSAWFNYNAVNDTFYLTTGHYHLWGSAPAYATNYTQGYIYDQTNSVIPTGGESAGGYANATYDGWSNVLIDTIIEVTATGNWHEMRIWTGAASATGHGIITENAGSNNDSAYSVGAQLKITKLRKGLWA